MNHRPSPKSATQVGPLVHLRWTMVRSWPARSGLLVLMTVPFGLAFLGVVSGPYVPHDTAVNLILLTPTVYLTFVLLAVLAPLTAGGGYDLFPSDQLVAFPVRARTIFRTSMLLAPANLAWVLSLVGLLVATALATGPPGIGTIRGMVSVLAFVLLVTVLGQVVAWLVVGLRQSRVGRIAVWATAAAIGATIVLVVHANQITWVLDRSPTKYALLNALAGANGWYRTWLVGLLIMASAAVAGERVGSAACAWALRRPGDRGATSGEKAVRQRAPRPTALRELIAIDRASVWRSPPLRRGLFVILVMPGLVAAAAAMRWQSLVLLPGLASAGAGLLFGVNAFCLDSSGATWLSTMPGWAERAFAAKTWIVTEICLLSVVAAMAGGVLRAPPTTNPADLTATLGCALTSVAVVVATVLHLSVRHPHRADLQNSRDTPAPPGSMAIYSARLAVVTTLIGLGFSASSLVGVWWIPLVAAVPGLAWAGMRIANTARSWADASVRAQVVATVSGG